MVGVATAALTAAGFLSALTATAASAAPSVPATAVTATPASQYVNQGGTVTVTGTVSPSGYNGVIGLAVTSGPDTIAGSPFLAKTTCAPIAGGTWTCSFTASSTATGVDQIIAFADNAATGSFVATDPHVSVTATIVGPPYRIALAPTNLGAAQSTCSASYTATVTDANGNPVPGYGVNVTATQSVTAPTPPATVTFCGVASQAALPPVVSGTTTTTGSSATTNPTGQSGQATFGVNSDTVGTVTVTDTNNGAVPPSSVTLTVSAGGADGVKSVSLTPASQNAFTTKTATVTYSLANASSEPVGLVPGGAGPLPSGVSATVISGPDTGALVTCTTSADGSGATPAGEGTCTFTSGATPGTDTVQVWVNQTCGTTIGLDSCEPSAKATVTTSTEPAFNPITSNCDGGAGTTCVLPLTSGSEVVTFNLTAGSPATPESGYVIAVGTNPVGATNLNGAKYTLSSTTCTTNAAGQCSVTVTNPSPSNGDAVTLTATLAADSAFTDTSTPQVRWEASTPSLVTITPEAATNLFGASVTDVVTVTDQFLTPVSGDTVTWVVAGRNNAGNNPGFTGTCTTGTAGTCTFTYKDMGPTTTVCSGPSAQSNAACIDTVTATEAKNGASDTARQYWLSAGGTVQQIAAGAANSTDPFAGCGTFAGTAPFAPSGWTPAINDGISPDTTSAGTPSAPTNSTCIAVRDANNNALFGQPVTVTSTGVGVLTDATGTVVPGNSETVNVGDGFNGSLFAIAAVYARSSQPGVQTITFTAGGHTTAVSITYSGEYVPVSPYRIIDTRTNQGGINTVAGPLAPSTTYYYNFSNSGLDNANIRAVVLNVTTISPTGPGNVRVFNACTRLPATSNVNFQPGADVANAVTVLEPAACGGIAFYVAGSTVNLAVDVTGYFVNGIEGPGGDGFNPPVRVLDTRTGSGLTQGLPSPLPAGQTESFSVTSAGAVPVGAAAVILNVTAIAPSGAGNLRVFPDGSTPNPPTTSNINYIAGVDKAAMAIVQLPANGRIDLYSAGSTANVAVDVMGYLDSAATAGGGNLPTNIVLQTPSRILDTRTGSGLTQSLPTPLAANTPYTFQVTGHGNVPAGAQAVLISVTSIAPSAGVGNLRVYPAGIGTPPTVSTLNYVGATADVANFAIIQLPANGQLTLYSAGSPVNVAVDVFGWVPAGT